MAKKLEGAQMEEMKVKEPVNQQIHRMCLLRVKLMHFVNSLHNYITTRVGTCQRSCCSTPQIKSMFVFCFFYILMILITNNGEDFLVFQSNCSRLPFY